MKRKEYYAAQYQHIRRPTPRGNGERSELRYLGPYYYYLLSPAAQRKVKRSFALLTALFAVCYLFLGLRGQASMGQFYVALPYAGAFLPLFLLAYETLYAHRLPRNMTERQYDAAVVKRLRCVLAMACLMGISALGSVVFACLHPEQLRTEVFFFLPGLLLAAVTVAAFRKLRACPVAKTQPNGPRGDKNIQ